MKNFISYFFGQGEEVEFKYFSLAHILPIIILAGVIALIIVYRNKIRNFKHEGRLRFAMAFTLIITEMSYFWRLVGVESLNANPVDHLPITVCGWAIIFCSFLVLTNNQNLFDITYFWVLTGSIFGILTPTVITYCGPTRFRYYQFWLEHTLGFVTLFYMMFVHGMRPRVKSMFKSYGVLLILAGIAIFANLNLPGANYLFMAMPEDTASILDILPKNYPLRVSIMAFLMALLFFLAYLPWLVIDLKRKKKGLPVFEFACVKVSTTEEKIDELIEENVAQKNVDTKEKISKKSTTKNKAETNLNNQNKTKSKDKAILVNPKTKTKNK
jgi:hypothetical integral membrane protein (TIGR02206 family)